MVQPYMNDTDTLENWKYLLKIYRYIEISYEPSILLIVIYPRERKAYVNQRLGTRICLATLPIIPQNWKHQMSINGTMDQLCYIYILEYHVVMKKNELLLCIIFWVNLNVK